jgi:DNA-binding SARP family transcriptional activator
MFLTGAGPVDRWAPASDRIEVRLLGPLRVRRADGSLVDSREWRTGKTADLVRLLALHGGQTVTVDTLVEALWPTAEAQRGRASLRTAVSQVRRVLGPDCVQRRLGGLELRDVWVDAAAFTSLVREVRRLAAAGQAAKAVTVAREADALYLDDFRAHSDGEEWAISARSDLARAYQVLICDAADAAVGLGWMRDAVEFAGRAVALDPYCEQAYRALMRGYAGLGQTPQALLEFQNCRTFLAEELGADPSAETQALHLRLLSTTTTEPTLPPFVGRRDAVNRLKRIIEASTETRRTTVVALVGAPGAGKSRLVSEACHELAARLAVVSCVPVDDQPVDCLDRLRSELRARAAQEAGRGQERAQPLVVILDDAGVAAEASIQQIVDDLHGTSGALTIVLVAQAGGVHGHPLSGLAPTRTVPTMRAPYRLELPPLTVEDVGELTGHLLSGDASADLVRALVEESGGIPRRAVDTLREWSHAGRIAATASGLVLIPRGGTRTTEPATKQLAPLLERLDATDLSVLHLLAVLASPTDPSVIVPLLDERPSGSGQDRVRGRVQETLDRLVDLSVLVAQPAGYAFRDPLLRDAVESWLRPTARRELHRRVAERAIIPTAARVQHWLKGGETQLGRAAALTAAGEAMADARYEDARTHLMQVCSLGAMPETVAKDRVDLFERLGDVCAVLGRRHEARAAYLVAVSVSRNNALPDLARIAAKRERVSEHDWPEDESVAHIPSPTRSAEWDTLDDDAPIPDIERRLRESLERVDRMSDPGPRAEARLRLAAAVCTPRRQFGLGRLWAQEALGITVDPRIRAKAIVAMWLPGVLLGQAELAEHPLEQAAELAESSGDADLQRRVHALQILVAHDLGRTEVEQHWADTSASLAVKSDANWTWIRVRIATECGDLAAAQAADRPLSHAGIGSFTRQMQALSSAHLRAELGDDAGAIELLQSIVDTQLRQGASLLLPEALARLIVLRSPSDLATAMEDFELLDRSVGGDHGFPREQYLRLLARSAVRSSNGQPTGAASAASNAAAVAASSALPHLADYANRVALCQPSTAGHPGRPVTATAAR